MGYIYGRNKERKVGAFLTRKGWKVWISRGSRGPWDLYAKKNSRRWCIQVKATRKTWTTASKLSLEAERRLKIAAAHRKATSVLALLAQNRVWFLSVKNYRLLDPK